MMIWEKKNQTNSKMHEMVKICYKTTDLDVIHFTGTWNCIHKWFY